MRTTEFPPARKLRVAFYMHDLSGGGVERMRLNLIAALRARNVDVSLVLGAKRGVLLPLLPADLQVVELDAARTLLAIRRLGQYLRAERPDILVSSLDHNNIAAMIARVLSGWPVKLVVCQHNSLRTQMVLGWKYRWVPWAYWILRFAANRVVAVSQGVADELSTFCKIPTRKITVIHNPVIDDAFLDRMIGDAPHPWLARKDRPVLIFVGRLTAQKGVALLLAAMEMVLHRRSVRLIVAGEGEDEVDLRRYARLHGIAHAVAFVGFQENPLPWIRHADALVLPSRYEGFGNVIVEALACGTPVIATDCPHGPAEILLSGCLGRLVPVGDDAALADAMEAYDTAGNSALQLQARAAAFTAAACADAHLDLFRELTVGRGGTVYALGMNFSDMRADEISDMIAKDFASDTVRLITTANMDHTRLLRNPAFAKAYANAYLATPDGFPVLIYARLKGLGLRARVTGCDIFGRLIRHTGLRRHKLFLVVESRKTEAAAMAWAQRVGIGDRVSIAVAPVGLGADDVAQSELVDRIRAVAPSILVMTLGPPVSEIFVDRHRDNLPSCWALCVGQALRVELGLARRAPVLCQQLGLEWLWRVAHEPRRLMGRYGRALVWFPVAIWRDLVHREGPLGG